MKRFMIAAAVLFLAASVAQAKGYEVAKKAGDLDVTITFDRNPPVAGDNNAVIELKGAGGHHVKDAQVKVEYSMPAMPGMPPMSYKTDAVLKGEAYHAALGLSMSGSWNITVKITREGKTSSMKFTVDAK